MTENGNRGPEDDVRRDPTILRGVREGTDGRVVVHAELSCEGWNGPMMIIKLALRNLGRNARRTRTIGLIIAGILSLAGDLAYKYCINTAGTYVPLVQAKKH